MPQPKPEPPRQRFKQRCRKCGILYFCSPNPNYRDPCRVYLNKPKSNEEIGGCLCVAHTSFSSKQEKMECCRIEPYVPPIRKGTLIGGVVVQ